MSRRIVAGNTAGSIHVAVPVEGVLQDMSTGGWACTTWLEDADHQAITDRRTVSDTEIPRDGAVPHFHVFLVEPEADQIIAPEDPTKYYWNIEIRRASPYYRQTFEETIYAYQHAVPEDALNDHFIQPEEEAGSTPFNTVNPDSLPARSPTNEELEELALLWIDRLPCPGDPRILASEVAHSWLPQQSNEVRNAVNALIKRVQGISGQIESSSSVVAEAYEAWAASQPDAAKAVEDWLRSYRDNGEYSRAFGDGFSMSFSILHDLSKATNVVIVENSTNHPVAVDVDWLTDPQKVTVGPFATAPTTDQYTIIVTGNN